jgi:hypothetical protein
MSIRLKHSKANNVSKLPTFRPPSRSFFWKQVALNGPFCASPDPYAALALTAETAILLERKSGRRADLLRLE